ncbi:MAG: hypothetical protein AB2L09_01885 [Coriobacteriia bacterium]
MEFAIMCPVDGPITVSLEDIDSVVLHESEQADVTFVCPHCGSEISVSGVVPSLLLDAIQAIAEDSERGVMGISATIISSGPADRTPSMPRRRGTNIEAYCEYFRRQLAHIETAEDAVAEIEGRS